MESPDTTNEPPERASDRDQLGAPGRTVPSQREPLGSSPANPGPSAVPPIPQPPIPPSSDPVVQRPAAPRPAVPWTQPQVPYGQQSAYGQPVTQPPGAPMARGYPPSYPAGALPPGALPPGAWPPGGYPPSPDGTNPAGAYPPGAGAPQSAPAGTYPPSIYPAGTYPPSTYAPGTYPPAAYPASAYPPGAYPPGTYPAGAYPPGTYPGGAYPPGAAPSPASGVPAYRQPGGYPPPPLGYATPAYGTPTAYPPYPAGGRYDPNASLNYYFPPQKPPRKGRTAVLISALVVVVLLVCAGGIFAYAQFSGDPGPTLADPTSGSTKSSTAPLKADDPSTIDGMLERQDQALLAGDEKAWLAPIEPSAHSAITAYQRIYHNMRAMHVAVWSSTVAGDAVSTTKESYEVDVTYCLVVKSCTDTQAEWRVSAKLVKGKVMILGFTAPKPSAYTSEPYPWEISTLSAVVGPRVVVAASSAWAGELDEALPIAERSATAADQYAHWGKPAIYVVYLASHADGKVWFDGSLRNADGVSYPIQPDDIEVTILMPEAQDPNFAGPGGLNTVIQHEMGHVATLHGDTQDRGHDSFIEGIAEYCAYTGHTSWAVFRMADVKDYIRKGEWSHSVYLTSQINGKDVLAGSAAYGIGYLGLRYLVKTYGLTTMLKFWGYFERDDDSLNASSEKAFHKSWKSVNASAAAYVEHAVGL